MSARGFFGRASTFIVCFLAVTTAAWAAPEVIYVNGKIVTVDDQFSIASGMAIEGDRFVAVGSSEQMLALADQATQVVDLGGKTVIPGLIDNHNHFIRGAYHWADLVRLDGVSTRAEALRLIQDHAATLDEDDWLLVLGGWNEEQFTDDPRGFTREELDQIAGNRPAFLQAQYSHAFVNTAFLNHIGADIGKPATDVPSNATIDEIFGPPLITLIERDANGVATSRLTGGMGMILQVSTVMPEQLSEVALQGVRAAQQHFNSLGLTTIYDPAGALATQHAIDAVEALHAEGGLSLRVFRTTQLGSLNSEAISRALELRALPDWLARTILGFVNDVESTSEAVDMIGDLPAAFTGDDFYDDLAIGEVLYVPMHDSMEHDDTEVSFTDHQVEEARNLLSEILAHGFSAQIHAVNPETLDAYLDIIEDLAMQYSVYPNQIAFTHAEGVNAELLRRIQALGVTLQIRSMQVLRSRNALEDAYGRQVVETPPLRTIQDSGVVWGLGTDGTKAAQINPMLTLYWAVTGRAINGDQILEQSQLLTREEALIAHTRSNAALVNRSNSLGQIRPGYLADFVVLNTDYLSVDEEEIRSIEADMTVVSGNVVYQRLGQ